MFATTAGEFVHISDADPNARGYNVTTAETTFGLDFHASPNFVIGIDGDSLHFRYDNADRKIALNRLVGIVMAPHYSGMSVGAYEKKLLDAAQGRVETALVRSWADHPRFLDAVAKRVTQALQRFPAPSAAPLSHIVD